MKKYYTFVNVKGVDTDEQFRLIENWCAYWFQDSNFRIDRVWIKKTNRLPEVTVWVSELKGIKEITHKFSCSHLLRDMYDFEKHHIYHPQDLVYGPEFFIGYVD